MYDFVDRVQTNPNRIKLTAVEGQENVYDYTKPGTVSEQGTDINRTAMLAIQGFQAKNTVFNDDGSITETNGLGQTMKTIFKDDGSIVEEFTGIGSKKITKTTTFKSDGSISEVISQ